MASKQVHKVAEQKKAPVSANAAKTSKDVKKEEKDLKKDEKQPGKAVKELPKDSKDPKKMEKDAKQSESVQSRGGHGRSRPEERNRSRERGRHSRDDRTNQRGQEKEVCRNFLHGRCDRGVLCKFSHPRSNSRGRSSDSGRQRSPVHAPGRNDNTDRVVCRDFVRNMCKRGDECRFYHPPNPENKRQRSSWLTFCHDFQNGHCSRSDCRFFHITKQDEDNYRASGEISPHVVDQAVRKALFLDVALTGTRPTCKEFLKGVCNMQNCRFRHLSRREYEDEVFHALQDEFEIVLGPPERQQSPGMNMFRSFSGYQDTPKYGTSPVNFREEMLGGEDLRTTLLARTEFEPETKRMRHYSDEPMFSQQEDFSNNQRRWDDRMDFDRQDFSSYDTERLMQEIFNLRNDNLELKRSSQQQIMELREELNAIAQENTNFRLENSNLRSSTSMNANQKSAIDKLIAANNTFMLDNRKFQETVRKLERENSDMRKTLESKQKAKNSELDRKVENLDKENREIRESLVRTTSALKKVQEEKVKVEQHLEELRAKLREFESRAQRKDEHYHNSQGSSRRDDYPADQMNKIRGSHVQGLDRRSNDSGFYGQDIKDQDMRNMGTRGQDRYEPEVQRTNSRGQYNQGHSMRGQDLHGMEMRGQDARNSDMRVPNIRGNDIRENDLRGNDVRGNNLRGNDARGQEMDRSRQGWSSSNNSSQQSMWPGNKDVLPPVSSGDVPNRTGSLLGEYQPMNDRFRPQSYPPVTKGQGLLRTPADFPGYNNQNMSQGLLDTPSDHHKTDSQFSSQRFEEREYRLGYNSESNNSSYGMEMRRPNTSQTWQEGSDSMKGRGMGQSWGRRGNTNQNF